MSNPRISNEWWSAPTESESGQLIIVTGREGGENVKATGKYNDRVEVTWQYTPDTMGMPDVPTSKLMEAVTESLLDAFKKDPIAVMTGIYTGDGQRNWIFYTRNPVIFGHVFNSALAQFELLPITIYVEKDPEWAEYAEMSECKVESTD